MTYATDWTPPHGMTVERPDHLPDCVVIGKDGGWVTVDMKNRFFGLGYCIPRRWGALNATPGFTGRGWEKRLLTAAADYLLSVQEA